MDALFDRGSASDGDWPLVLFAVDQDAPVGVRFICLHGFKKDGRGGIHDASPQATRPSHQRRTGVMNAAPPSVVERERLPCAKK